MNNIIYKGELLEEFEQRVFTREEISKIDEEVKKELVKLEKRNNFGVNTKNYENKKQQDTNVARNTRRIVY